MVMKIKSKTVSKRKLIKGTVKGIVVIVLVQLFIVAKFWIDIYQPRHTDLHTETVYVEKVEYVNLSKRKLYVYPDENCWKLDWKLVREHTDSSVKQICQDLEGASLTVTYQKVFQWWKWNNVVAEVYCDDTVYYTIDEYNAELKSSVGGLVFLEILCVLGTTFWVLVKKYELKCLANGSKQKKLSKLRKH